jgi:hypothetical protein
MKFFGPGWPDDFEHADAPVDHACARCCERIAAGEPGVLMPYFNGTAYRSEAWHRECYLRMVVGSVGHQLGRCSCHGGTEEDPEGMSTREAAAAAVALYEQRLRPKH